jgi:hypothetical protein
MQVCLEVTKEIQSQAWICRGCVVALTWNLNRAIFHGQISETIQPTKGAALICQLTSSEGCGGSEGCTELRGEGGDCWRETDLLLSRCPDPSLSAWEPGGRLV